MLKKNYEFKSVLSKGKYYTANNIEAFIVENRKDFNLLGLAISTKIGKAVKRNMIKRLMRESYRNLENYIKRLTKLEEIAKEFEGVDKSYAIQAGREVRILVKPEIVDDEGMKLVAREIVKKIEDELEYPGQIKVHLIRESRAVDYAK